MEGDVIHNKMDAEIFIATSESPDETQNLAAKLCSHLSRGDILSLTGDLGAGKTCFVKGLAKGLEIPQTITSPTFNLIREYSGSLPMYHFDVYRIKNLSELYELGYEEYFFGDGVTVIEWGDKIAALLPQNHLRIDFKYSDNSTKRSLTIEPGSKSWESKIIDWGKDAGFSI